jgi:hypothetical protein
MNEIRKACCEIDVYKEDRERMFWENIVKDRENPKRLFIGGRAFYMSPDEDYLPNCGFGGRRFIIRRNCGEILETRNLWSNGDIPREYREMLPDNAEFL